MRGLLSLLLLALMLTALVGCGGATNEAPPPTQASAPAEELPPATAPAGAEPATEATEVMIEGFQYVPATIEVPVGGSVMWTNLDDVPHTATSGASPDADGTFDTGNLAQNSSQSVTFDEAGSYTYFCSIHPNMVGTVVVGP